jgi:RimJ/RimL family protein N-acetyltransferase
MTLEQPVLRGLAVTLRPLVIADASALASAAAESREHYRFNPVPEGIEGASAYIEKALSERDAGLRLPFAVIWNGRVSGSTSYRDPQIWDWPKGSLMLRPDRPDSVEIGSTWLAASAQRTRCNTECKYLLLNHAFETWDVHRAFLKTDERNARSRQAIERLGAVFEGVRRSDMPAQDGTLRNSAYYSIIRAEWPGVKSRLEGFLDAGSP